MAKLRVVLDACNGAGSIVGPKLLERLAWKYSPLTINLMDNSRARGASPENLGDLCAAVKTTPSRHRICPGHGRRRLAIVSGRAADW